MRTNSTSSFGSSSSFRLEEEGAKSPVAEIEGLQDYKYHLTKYGKCFSTKLIQILVQSRTTDKFSHSCTGNVDRPTEWFNLQLDELGEVTAFIKNLKIDKFPPTIPQISIDFFLYTCDHETLPLETWSFRVDEYDRKGDMGSPNDHRSELYHQLSTLLRSAMVAARMTPMHRYYVKKQSAETYVILYRVSPGPSTIDIGKDARRVRVGCLPTYLGSWKLEVAYRTRMEIEPNNGRGVDESESFQRIGSPGSTPDSFKMQIESPSSFGGISHFSTSPSICSPVDFSPLHDGFLQSRIQSPNVAVKPTRSRSTSLASDVEDVTVETIKEMQQSVTLPKGMPFVNLLGLSYSGTLFPLVEGASEQEEDNSSALNASNITVMAHSSKTTNVMESSLEDRSRSNTVVEVKRPKDLLLKNALRNKPAEDEESCVTPQPPVRSDDDLTPQDENAEDITKTLVGNLESDPMESSTPKETSIASSLKEDSPLGGQDVIFKMGSSSCFKSGESEVHENVLAGRSRLSPGKASSGSPCGDNGNKENIDTESSKEKEMNDKNNQAGSENKEVTNDNDAKEEDDDGGDDDGSFVKIPPFENAQGTADEEEELAALLSHCKEAPTLSSLPIVDITTLDGELEELSLKQGLFDRFISEIREAALEDEY